MLKKLYDEEMEKMKIPTYLGGGFEPPYGPLVEKCTKDFFSMEFKVYRMRYARVLEKAMASAPYE